MSQTGGKNKYKYISLEDIFKMYFVFFFNSRLSKYMQHYFDDPDLNVFVNLTRVVPRKITKQI